MIIPRPARDFYDNPNAVYNRQYYEGAYAANNQAPYSNRATFYAFFSGLAKIIFETWRPAVTMDVGCAYGYLVEALHMEYGVNAFGADVSEFAISQAADCVRGRCFVRSATEPLWRTFDLITCIEIVEHLKLEDARKTIANMCAATSRIIFSSDQTAFADDTHLTVRPHSFWRSEFAKHGFFQSAPFPAISAHGFVYERADWWMQ